jgi:hypothetical protein
MDEWDGRMGWMGRGRGRGGIWVWVLCMGMGISGRALLNIENLN